MSRVFCLVVVLCVEGGKPPYDSDITVTIDVLQATPISVMATVSTLAGLGIILASLFLGFNVWYRKHK